MNRRFPFLSDSIVASLGCVVALCFLWGSCHAIEPNATGPSPYGGNPLYALHILPEHPIRLATTLSTPSEDNKYRATPFPPGPPQCPYETWKRALALPVLGHLDLRLFCVPAGRRPGD